MNLAITSGGLSSLDTHFQNNQSSNWLQINNILRKLPPTYEVFDIYPERLEILLKILNPFSFNSEEIRSLLQKLQESFQRSFVALINIKNYSILITVRG
ncbi:MAG: hypothetical protein ACFFCZ_28605 [Promethearchaeota archaeon]